MIFWMQKFIWCGTLALGLQFLYIGIRVRFDRSFVWFGLSLLLFAMVLLGDAWGLRDPLVGTKYARWTLVAHEGALALFPAIIWFCFHITGQFLKRALRVFLVFDLGAALFLLVVEIRGEAFHTFGYGFVFLPWLIFGLTLGALPLWMKIRISGGRERKGFLFLAAGCCAVAVPSLLGISLVLFVLLALAPGDPFGELAANTNIPPELHA